MRKLVDTINKALGERARPDRELHEAFDVWWPKLEHQLKHLPPETNGVRRQRSDRELLEEILAIVREQSRTLPPKARTENRSGTSTSSDSFESTLRNQLEALPGVSRAKVESRPDCYQVEIQPEPSVEAISIAKRFEFAWDEEPLNSTGQRAIEKSRPCIAELKAERAEEQKSYANEDTPDIAQFRRELLNQLRRRKTIFSADAIEHCRIEKTPENRLVFYAPRRMMLALKEPKLPSIATQVYEALFGRVPNFEV